MQKNIKILNYNLISMISILFLLILSISLNNEIVISILGQQNTESEVYNVCSYTFYIPKNGINYCYFYANSPITSIDLFAEYQELNGNELMVTLYDSSSCNIPYGNPGFDIRTCMTWDSSIYNEIEPFGNINLSLYPGEYFLTFEPASYRDVRVSIDIYVKSYFGVNAGSNDVKNFDEDGDDSGLNRCLLTPNYGPWILSPPVCY
ncbi:MAG: hypothetical protein ACR2F1_10220 [Nitrososphaeraceae archaeon]